MSMIASTNILSNQEVQHILLQKRTTPFSYQQQDQYLIYHCRYHSRGISLKLVYTLKKKKSTLVLPIQLKKVNATQEAQQYITSTSAAVSYECTRLEASKKNKSNNKIAAPPTSKRKAEPEPEPEQPRPHKKAIITRSRATPMISNQEAHLKCQFVSRQWWLFTTSCWSWAAFIRRMTRNILDTKVALYEQSLPHSTANRRQHGFEN